MKKMTRARPSAALCVAMLALFVALGGGSYAAVQKASDHASTAKKSKKAKRGPAGPAGPAGGLNNVTQVTAGPVSMAPPNDGGGSATANCPAGTKLVGGGGKVDGEINVLDNTVFVAESHPIGNGWYARGNNVTSSTKSDDSVTAIALCAG